MDHPVYRFILFKNAEFTKIVKSESTIRIITFSLALIICKRNEKLKLY